jgi:hypothetical protein
VYAPCTNWQIVVFQLKNLSRSFFGFYEERELIETGPIAAFSQRPLG